MKKHEHWWKEPRWKAHSGVFSVIKLLGDQVEERERTINKLYNVYTSGDIKPLSYDARTRAKDAWLGARDKLPVTENVLRSAVDTTCSMIVINQPKPMALTDEGNYKQKTRAKKLDQFIEGILYQEGYYEKAEMAFKDAAITGIGWIKVYPGERGVKVERVHPSEMVVDDLALGSADTPRVLFQKKKISAEVLLSSFEDSEDFSEKKKKVILDKVKDDRFPTRMGSVYSVDLVEVVEAWHLPSSPSAKDGRHVICVDGATLFDEKWERSSFPFACIRWSNRHKGFYGQGLVEQLFTIQVEYNKVIQRFQSNFNLLSNAWVFAQEGSIKPDKLINDAGIIVEYKGNIKPDIQMPPGVISGDAFAYKDGLRRSIYENAGTSEVSASGLRPSDRTSGIARRLAIDLESRRHVGPGRRWEKLAIDTAKLVIRCAREMSDDGLEIKSKYLGKSFLKRIDWKEVDMDDDMFVLRLYPTNLLPSTPTGKLSTVQDMMQGGLIDPVEGRSLLDYPDIGDYLSKEQSDIDIIDKHLSMMLDDGEVAYPSDFQNLELTLKRATKARQKAEIDGAPDERISLVEDYIDATLNLISPEQEQLPMPMPPDPGVPGGALAPTGEMAPVAPGGVAAPTDELPI